MTSTETKSSGSGWSMFAGVFLAIAGLLNAIDGLVALFQKGYFNEAGLVYQNLQAWGWTFLIVGIVQIIVGYLIIGRSPVARWIGLILAVISMVVAFFAIGAYPWWALVVIVVDGLVVYGLTARWES